MPATALKGLFTLICISFLVSPAASVLQACPTAAQRSHSDYDFVVIGAGAGGGPLAARLALNGFSVLVVDAGHDVVNVNTTIPFYFPRAVNDPQLELNYTYNEYSPGAQFPRDDTWYPRARGLGGSTVHNGLINDVGAMKADFGALATMFNDSTWSYDNMRNYFIRIEDNLYEPHTDADHGFDGWLKTSINPTSILGDFPDAQLNDIAGTLAVSASPYIDDLNSPANDVATGIATPSFTIDENYNRSSVHDWLLTVEKSSSGKLQFAFDTLATKIMLCTNGPKTAPVAYGVQVAPNAALPVASNFKGKQKLVTKVITARYEVIISAGVVQTPQLLMLSGIGDPVQLQKFDIEPVVSSPGVGTNLQDHDEVANIWLLKQNHTLFNGCTVLSNPAEDPCLAYWTESDHQNIYSLGAALFMTKARSSPAEPEPNLTIYWVPAFFRGFVRGFADEIATIHNALTAIVLLGHPSSRGTVKLTGNHPQDVLQIEKNHFEAPGGQADIAAIRTGIQLARSVVASPNITQHIEVQAFPAPDNGTDTQIDDHILQHVFGHHLCCTAAMGPADDPMALVAERSRVVRHYDHLHDLREGGRYPPPDPVGPKPPADVYRAYTDGHTKRLLVLVKRSLFLTLSEQEAMVVRETVTKLERLPRRSHHHRLQPLAQRAVSRFWDDPRAVDEVHELCKHFSVGAFGDKADDDSETDDESVCSLIYDRIPALDASMPRPEIPNFEDDTAFDVYHGEAYNRFIKLAALAGQRQLSPAEYREAQFFRTLLRVLEASATTDRLLQRIFLECSEPSFSPAAREFIESYVPWDQLSAPRATEPIVRRTTHAEYSRWVKMSAADRHALLEGAPSDETVMSDNEEEARLSGALDLPRLPAVRKKAEGAQLHNAQQALVPHARAVLFRAVTRPLTDDEQAFMERVLGRLGNHRAEPRLRKLFEKAKRGKLRAHDMAQLRVTAGRGRRRGRRAVPPPAPPLPPRGLSWSRLFSMIAALGTDPTDSGRVLAEMNLFAHRGFGVHSTPLYHSTPSAKKNASVPAVYREFYGCVSEFFKNAPGTSLVQFALAVLPLRPTPLLTHAEQLADRTHAIALGVVRGPSGHRALLVWDANLRRGGGPKTKAALDEHVLSLLKRARQPSRVPSF
ncbi:Choline dehydrogenase [Mycena sanguinolenta]|uniref:Choline dehydrogenase n=1 Tax=Mycena sanguinolenta TaxID=230812 RepID=A0A8H7CM26_9AGAR|nr:Choline dehydrogenase [Mycena sanguinolenta]